MSSNISRFNCRSAVTVMTIAALNSREKEIPEFESLAFEQNGSAGKETDEELPSNKATRPPIIDRQKSCEPVLLHNMCLDLNSSTTSLQPVVHKPFENGSAETNNNHSPNFKSTLKNGPIPPSPTSVNLLREAWEALNRSRVYFRGYPIGTIAALDHSVDELNYNQVDSC